MQASIHRDSIKKLIDYALYVGISLVVVNELIYYRLFFESYIPFQSINLIINQICDRNEKLFNNNYVLKLTGMALIAIAGYGYYGNKNPSIKRATVINAIIIGTVLLIVPSFIFSNSFAFPIHIINMAIVLMGLSFFVYGCTQYNSISESSVDDFFNKERETFPQQTKKVTNDISVNIPYKFYYKKKWNNGWINLVNPMQGIMVAGKPGSGKSFGILIPCIHALIKRDFTGMVYDFKYPTLAFDAINALIEHAQTRNNQTLPLPKLSFFDMDNPLKSCRVNPIAPEYITDMIDASESATMIFEGLTTGNKDKGSDFFTQSGINILSAIIFFLRDVEINQKKVLIERYNNLGRKPSKAEIDDLEFCTIPHVLEMFCLPFPVLFNFLNTNRKLEFTISTFINALEGGAAEMLNGQIATSTMKLSPVVSETMYYLFSKNEVNLRINRIDNPTLLVIGNNPERQEIYRSFISLIVGRILKLVNSQGRRNCMLIMDEFPTITVKGIDNLMNTGRSVGIATVLGLQVKSQLTNTYGELGGETILTSVGSTLVGKTEGKFAQEISDKIGKSNQAKEEMTFSDSVSIAERENFNNIVPVDTLSNLSTGEMVGTLTDDIKAPLEYKRFHGFVNANHQDFPTSQVFYKAKETFDENKVLRKELPDELFDVSESSKQEMEEIFSKNYYKIKDDITRIIALEVQRITRLPDGAKEHEGLVKLDIILDDEKFRKYRP